MSSFPIIEGSRIDDVGSAGELILLDYWQASCAPAAPWSHDWNASPPTIPTASPATASTSTPTPTPSPSTA
jgi:hypothetical protein